MTEMQADRYTCTKAERQPSKHGNVQTDRQSRQRKTSIRSQAAKLLAVECLENNYLDKKALDWLCKQAASLIF